MKRSFEKYSAIFWTVLLLGGSALGFYLLQPCLKEEICGGNTVPGFFAGLTGFLFILLSLAYLGRKQWFHLTLGRLQLWLYAHMVFGILSLIFITVHSGFYLRNHLAVIAFFFLALTIISGAAGLALFYFLPRRQFRHEAAVMLPEDLCQRLSRLHDDLARLCQQKGGVYAEIYEKVITPLYQTPLGQALPSADLQAWAHKMPAGPDEEFINFAVKVETAHDLLVLLAAHLRWKWFLDSWLFLHIPATIGLIVFSFAHLIVIAWLGVR